MPDPITPNPQGSQVPGQSAQQPAGGQTLAVKPIDEFVAKKKLKSVDDIPKIYEETEASFHRTNQALQSAKQDIETQTGGQKTLDDKGKIIDNPNFHPGFIPQGQPGQYQPQGGYGQPETIYDAYSGAVITDPVTIQLIKNFPDPTQRQIAITNAVIMQNDKLQRDSYVSEQEVLNTPEAKGFENDVRSVMQALPLHQRADKKQWQDALLRVKGMKFDQMRQSAGQEGVENFLNKQGMQPLPEAPGGTGGVRLSPEDEKSFQWYQANQPGMFRDRAHFAQRLSNKR